MNILPDATSILCYGDSNTYGQKPDRSGRYPANTRWTGIMQADLGAGYYIIEEGLGGRTTNLDHPNPNKPNRNGLTYFNACLDSHSPLDIIIIMLGTNDFKVTYNRTPAEIADALAAYIDCIDNSYPNPTSKPHILLVSPPYMDDDAPLFHSSMPTPGIYDATSITKSHELAEHIKQLTRTRGLHFFDAAPVTQAGEDGCHITESSHRMLGQELARIIQAMRNT
jgi:lysophospholipase L1-like esterase